MTLRIGHGLDAHRFSDGRPLMLGGVRVEHGSGLAGHSDGDAAVHALCDALLGAAGLGDMGSRFPSHDERWRDASGVRFLEEVAGALDGAGATVESAQVVIVAEAPRLAVHLDAMARVCAAALRVAPGTVKFSVTSTDAMGFTGRGEGVAASAVALVSKGG